MSQPAGKRDVYVYADWSGLDAPLLMGILHAGNVRGKEIFSFEYEDKWLQSGFSQILDPDLQMFSGIQYLSDPKKVNFGLFLDSSPDRWGRILMQRREALEARMDNRPVKPLFESDYLLGVFDPHRMGALRFKTDPAGPFLNDNEEMACPPWTSIRELEQVSLHLENEHQMNDPEYARWLKMIIAPGSSLGGSRPKASILDNEDRLWIAKFPSQKDTLDSGGWEMVTCELAKKVGISMAESQARRFSSDHHTFLTRRFDRTAKGKRIHFASAMTLLGYSDGMDHSGGASYLELVEFIASKGANVKEDLEQLWRRIVFSICISNVDDHLRNHGFLLTAKGWILSPAYDMNPEETGTGLALNISDSENALDIGLALEVCGFFRVEEKKAKQIISETKKVVSTWREIARKYQISRFEQDMKSTAFSKSAEL